MRPVRVVYSSDCGDAKRQQILDTVMSTDKKIKVTLKKSVIGRLRNHKACVAGLGLRKMHQTVEVIDTPANRGLINKVAYLLAVEES